jgi:hypothetical protein
LLTGHSRESGNPVKQEKAFYWIPVFTGMTKWTADVIALKSHWNVVNENRFGNLN